MPDTARARAGRSLNAILKYTPPYVKNRARDEHIVIKQLRYTFTKGGSRAVSAKLVNMTTTAPQIHTVTVIGLDSKASPGSTSMEKMRVPRLFKQKRIQVSCSCDNFTYYWEYALWSWGAAKIKNSNGETPSVTNPHLVPGGCKHLVVVLRAIYEKQF